MYGRKKRERVKEVSKVMDDVKVKVVTCGYPYFISKFYKM